MFYCNMKVMVSHQMEAVTKTYNSVQLQDNVVIAAQ